MVLKKVLEEESCILIDWYFKNFMKANPTKFQAICIGKNAHENIASFKVDSVEIKCEENVTLLGVNIDFMLSFGDHVTDICKKASKQLTVLKRLGRFLTKQGKLTIYNTFVVSNFNYCPLAWHFVVCLAQTRWRKYKRGFCALSTMISRHFFKISCLPQVLSLCM